MDLPEWLMVHTVVVEALSGQGAYGDVYADPVEVPCLRSEKRRLVRNADGEQVVAETTITTLPDWWDRFPEDSRVTVPETGRTMHVIAATLASDGGMGAWQHTEVALA